MAKGSRMAKDTKTRRCGGARDERDYCCVEVRGRGIHGKRGDAGGGDSLFGRHVKSVDDALRYA